MGSGSGWGAVLCVWVRGWCRRPDHNLVGDPGLWKADEEKPGAQATEKKGGSEARKDVGMEAELQSYGMAGARGQGLR